MTPVTAQSVGEDGLRSKERQFKWGGGGDGSLTYILRATKTNPNSTSSWIKEPNVKYFHKKIQEYARFPKEDKKSTNFK